MRAVYLVVLEDQREKSQAERGERLKVIGEQLKVLEAERKQQFRSLDISATAMELSSIESCIRFLTYRTTMK